MYESLKTTLLFAATVAVGLALLFLWYRYCVPPRALYAL